MRILAVTDVHGAYSQVVSLLGLDAFDVLVIGGDLTTFGNSKEASNAIRQFQEFQKPVLVVGGNMDPPDLDETFDHLGVSINARGVILNDVGFFGVSGAPFSPMNTPNEIPEEEIMKRADAGWHEVEKAKWKVFVPHAPPFNTSVDTIGKERHVGSSSVRTFIEEKQPDVVICGHIHESMGLDTIGKSRIVNCGPAGKGSHGIITIGESIVVEHKRGKGR
jgi:Icc-related predicted phosphoesterase